MKFTQNTLTLCDVFYAKNYAAILYNMDLRNLDGKIKVKQNQMPKWHI